VLGDIATLYARYELCETTAVDSAEKPRLQIEDIIGPLPLGVVIIEREQADDPLSLRVMAVNAAADRFSPVPITPHVGRRIIDDFPDAPEQGTIALYNGVLDSQESTLVPELRYDFGDGNVSYAETNCIPLDEHRLMIVFRSLDDEKNTERMREALQVREKLYQAQQALLEQLSAPVIPVREGILVMPLIGRIDASRGASIKEGLLGAIAQHRARFVIIDVTGVAAIDSHVADVIISMSSAARLLGTETILTGLQPAVAQVLVELGVDLIGLKTQRTLQSALESIWNWQR
jgi:anti-anti-sigma factor